MSKFETMGQSKEVTLSQGTIRYRESGTGETLLFIHGFLVNGDLWRKVVPPLAQNYRCIVPDWPLGSHEVALSAQADLTPSGIARLIADFAVALDLTDVTLIGNDTGGALAQLVIAEHPERIGRLVLTNCDAFENFPPPLLSGFLLLGKVPGLLFLLAQLLKLNIGQKAILSLVVKYPVEQLASQSYTLPLTDKGIRRDLTKLLKSISNRYTLAAAQKFARFNRPVLLVWAERDFLFPKKYAERLAKAFPNARLEYVQDSKAFVSEDQPARLVDLVKAFIGQPVTAKL